MIKKIFIAIIAMLMISCESQNQQTMNNNSDIENVIMSRRSIRKWQDKVVEKELLTQILKHGINAPNGKGIQAYEIRVINNPAMLKEMSEAVEKDMPEVSKRVGYQNIFVDAPCVVFIASYDDYDLSQVDCGLLGENIMLSAWSKGIGSCCLGSSARFLKNSANGREYLNKLNFSEHYQLLYCIALGYPNESPNAKPRNESKIRFIDNF